MICKCDYFIKYISMIIPRYGLFTNNAYDIVGIMWLGTLTGLCTYSKYPNIKQKDEYLVVKEYHLSSDIKPQFVKFTKACS